MTRGRSAVVFALGMLLGGAIVGLVPRTPELPPTWHDELSLTGPRTYAQAVTLATGQVLLLGGMDRDSNAVTNGWAEILDPRAGTVRREAEPRIARMWQSVTTLPNDLVLVIDGTERHSDGGWYALAYADAFDPWTARWHAVSAPSIPRSDHAAVLLRDGRVLVIGGNDGPRWVRQSEIYDPATDRWSLAASLPVGRTRFTAATLPDGRVLVAGGFAEPGATTDQTLIYDPASDAWTDGPPMIAKRAIHSEVTLPSGDLLFIGGQEESSNTAERYDLRGHRFVFAGTLASPRMFGQAAVAEDGSVIFAGGIVVPQSGFDPTSDVERWDPSTNLWSVSAPLHTARAGGAMVTAPGGIWLLGGSIEDDHATDSVELLRSP